MAKEQILSYTRPTGEEVKISRDGRDMVVRIDDDEVDRVRLTLRRGDTVNRVALSRARHWQEEDALQAARLGDTR